MSRIYLDHNATTPPRAEVLDRLAGRGSLPWANPASQHAEGRESRTVLEQARERVASLLAMPASGVVFTSGGTEAAHAALCGCARATRRESGATRVVISALEHASMRGAAAALEREGFTLVTVPAQRSGVVDAGSFVGACGQGTAAAALMAAQNEIGTLQPVAEVGWRLAGLGVPLVVDAVQAPGRLWPILPGHDGVVVISGHKMGGLPGAGAVLAPPDRRLEPVIAGGEQERGRRGGTPALMPIAAMGLAAGLLRAEQGAGAAGMADRRDRFESELLARLDGVLIVGASARRLPNTTALVVEGVLGEDLAAALDLAGIAVSTGSACSTGAGLPSPALQAMGWSGPAARGLLRVSQSTATTDGEMASALERLIEAARRLRSAAPAAGVRLPETAGAEPGRR